MTKITLEPLLRDGRNCLACRDVEGIEWAALESVEFYYGGSPWQRIIRKSDDFFALIEKEIFQWPTLERIIAARFRIRLKNDRRTRHVNIRPSVTVVSFSEGGEPAIQQWLVKRGFIEVSERERQSLE